MFVMEWFTWNQRTLYTGKIYLMTIMILPYFIYRDLASRNVLLAEDGTAKVC